MTEQNIIRFNTVDAVNTFSIDRDGDSWWLGFPNSYGQIRATTEHMRELLKSLSDEFPFDAAIMSDEHLRTSLGGVV